MKDVNIYIHTEYQGSLSKGSGKWHVILECMVKTNRGKEEPATVKEMGFESEITKNRLELTALEKALKHLTGKNRVTIYTASDYITSALNGWLDKWAGEGFCSKKRPVKHADLWQSVYGIIEQHNITVIKATKTSYTAVQSHELRDVGEGKENEP